MSVCCPQKEWKKRRKGKKKTLHFSIRASSFPTSLSTTLPESIIFQSFRFRILGGNFWIRICKFDANVAWKNEWIGSSIVGERFEAVLNWKLILEDGNFWLGKKSKVEHFSSFEWQQTIKFYLFFKLGFVYKRRQKGWRERRFEAKSFITFRCDFISGVNVRERQGGLKPKTWEFSVTL